MANHFGLYVAVLVFCSCLCAQSQPQIGQLCPPDFYNDAANCFLGKPLTSSGLVITNGELTFTTTSGTCQLDATPFSAAQPQFTLASNLCYRTVPAGYDPFIFNNSFYVSYNKHFVRNPSTVCPPNTQLDGNGCFVGSPPTGRTAVISGSDFGFNRLSATESCATVKPNSIDLNATTCSVGNVSAGFTGVVIGGNWYAQPLTAQTGWFLKDNISDQAWNSRPVSAGTGPLRNWTVVWKDDFNSADNLQCSTDNTLLWITRRPGWGDLSSADSPTAWQSNSVSSWTLSQEDRYEGIRQLDKCRWSVYDSFNSWDLWSSPGMPLQERTNSLLPKNIKIQNGWLRLTTSAEPTVDDGFGYDCGVQKEPDPLNNGDLYSNDCPYSGALLTTSSNLPWSNGNSDNNINPANRFIGRQVGYGRIEFRARIKELGHGGWPALWLFADQLNNPGEGIGEIDVLEFLADLEGPHDQILKQSSTYGMAMQTLHNWGTNTPSSEHVAHGVSIPIGLNEWHLFAVEYEPTELRFYIDGTMTQRIGDGQEVVEKWSGKVQTLKLPKGQTFSIIVNDVASDAAWLPEWYRSFRKKTDQCGNNVQYCSSAEPFRITTIDVDYVAYYTDSSLPPPPARLVTAGNGVGQLQLMKQLRPAKTAPSVK